MDIQDITPEDSIVPVYLIPLTPQEEEEIASQIQKNLDEESAVQDALMAKQSALAKLAKLGLTEEEARAVIGL